MVEFLVANEEVRVRFRHGHLTRSVVVSADDSFEIPRVGLASTVVSLIHDLWTKVLWLVIDESRD